MYFSVHPDPYEGFLRALSVAAGSHMPRLQKANLFRPASQARYSVARLGTQHSLKQEK